MDNYTVTTTAATVHAGCGVERTPTPRPTNQLAVVRDRPQPRNHRGELIQRILDCSGSVFQSLNPGDDRAWQALDLTMPQLKTLICVVRLHGPTSSQVARALRVGLSTVTGIVDRLAQHGFVTRREDLKDRRVTRVLPTRSGQHLVAELLAYRTEAIAAILSRTDPDRLTVVETAFQYLLEAINEPAGNRPGQEVVA